MQALTSVQPFINGQVTTNAVLIIGDDKPAIGLIRLAKCIGELSLFENRDTRKAVCMMQKPLCSCLEEQYSKVVCRKSWPLVTDIA